MEYLYFWFRIGPMNRLVMFVSVFVFSLCKYTKVTLTNDLFTYLRIYKYKTLRRGLNTGFHPDSVQRSRKVK